MSNVKKEVKIKGIALVIGLAILFIIFTTKVYSQQDFTITPERIDEKVKVGDFLEEYITIKNNKKDTMSISFSLEKGISDIVKLDEENKIIEPESEEDIKLTIFGENLSRYQGSFIITGDIVKTIPLNITVHDLDILPVDALMLDIEPITDKAAIGDVFEFKVGVQNLLTDRSYKVTLHYSIDRLENETTYQFDKVFFEETETVDLATALTIVKEFELPKFIRPGTYVINVKADFLGMESSTSRSFRVIEPFWDHVILGILPVRWVIFIGFFLIAGIGGYIYYMKKKAKKKRYVVKIDYNLLPKPGPRAAYLGMIAETNKKTYFDLEQLTIHTLIAGSTGGGKTVSAEVIVEEALLKGCAVIVFDPTAQWTGFLRKNTEKKMFGLYPKFGMKKTDARAFNGNVRQILDARELIDIKKFIKPGEINVFSITKLDPEDADVLVSNTIRQIFKANLPESRELKLLVIFDEVHRLLPKFGGSGQGFIQIERGAREFRKWGVGLMLISQVLKDFVGETKANINTEIQMRTRDQGDLDRIKDKYGGYMLQSLLKSSTGTGMMENASYNKGNPYFISFRPLLHEHARLSDEELENYNKYNEMIDNLEFQIEQLEKDGIDIFDLKLELKMALDKVKSGSFNMVDIYLEGLKPRIAEQWKKLGKTPEKRKTKYVSEDELKEELQKAKEERKKFEKKGGGGSSEGENSGGGGGAKDKPLTLKNGNMIIKKTELQDNLEAMDDETFLKEIEGEKNNIADWLEGINKNLAAEFRKAKTREEAIKVMQENG